VNATARSRGLDVAGGGTGIVSHAGLVLLRLLADRTGLTDGLSLALPSPGADLDRQGARSKTWLRGLDVAILAWLKPASLASCRMRAGPAWFPSP
jgi:hypothetical protein